MVSSTATYVTVVQYDNGERAKFPHPTYERAVDNAQSLQKLPTVRKIWVNEVVLRPCYEWTRS